MSEQAEEKCQINKGFREIGPSGKVMIEKWCTVKGDNLKEISEEFDKQWKDLE